MCCSSGVCGPSVDSELARFASDLEWLKTQGIIVSRFNLAQQPSAFAENEDVHRELQKSGTDCLPILLLEGSIVSLGKYPDRKELALLAGVGGKLDGSPEGDQESMDVSSNEKDCSSGECAGKG
jgi:hypothetical protein